MVNQTKLAYAAAREMASFFDDAKLKAMSEERLRLLAELMEEAGAAMDDSLWAFVDALHITTNALRLDFTTFRREFSTLSSIKWMMKIRFIES